MLAIINFSGTWNANLLQSTFVGPRPQSMQVRIDHRDLELQEELLVTKADGSLDRAVLVCVIGGEHTTMQLNGKALRGVARWEGATLVLESWTKFGERELHFCDCWSLSLDGQTLVMEHANDALAGQRVVLNRVSRATIISDTNQQLSNKSTT